MDMEQWARVRRKVLMDGRSKRSVSMPPGLPVAGGAGRCRRYSVLQSSTQQLETAPALPSPLEPLAAPGPGPQPPGPSGGSGGLVEDREALPSDGGSRGLDGDVGRPGVANWRHFRVDEPVMP